MFSVVIPAIDGLFVSSCTYLHCSIGVNITAFGWEIPLFDFHLATYPTFFSIFRIEKIDDIIIYVAFVM